MPNRAKLALRPPIHTAVAIMVLVGCTACSAASVSTVPSAKIVSNGGISMRFQSDTAAHIVRSGQHATEHEGKRAELIAKARVLNGHLIPQLFITAVAALALARRSREHGRGVPAIPVVS